jgi:hypothetical protein
MSGTERAGAAVSEAPAVPGTQHARIDDPAAAYTPEVQAALGRLSMVVLRALVRVEQHRRAAGTAAEPAPGDDNST